MRRHRRREEEAASSSDEEDAFAVLAKKNKKKNSNKKAKTVEEPVSSALQPAPLAAASYTPSTVTPSVIQAQANGTGNENNNIKTEDVPVASKTSSTKRHHKLSQTRKQKMDALLTELNADTHHKRVNLPSSSSVNGGGLSQHNSSRPNTFRPDKKGSFVDPEEEHLTTNIFVGNLAPCITEEELTDLFRQFGPLYSVKIMWPRNPEERARNRHTGFVCFMNRRDAQDALDACNGADPFNSGYVLKLGWGKDIRPKNHQEIQQRHHHHQAAAIARVSTGGAGGNSTIPLASLAPTDTIAGGPSRGVAAAEVAVPSNDSQQSDSQSVPAASIAGGVVADTSDPSRCIRVIIPTDPKRAHFISTIAHYVATDGSELEQLLIQREAAHPSFQFMKPLALMISKEREEHIYYKWRIFSFCQGDTFSTWRTEPFVMLTHNTKAIKNIVWIPPHMDAEAARREQALQRERELAIERQKQQRRFLHARRDYMTGRQLEQLAKSTAKLAAPGVKAFVGVAGSGGSGGIDSELALLDQEEWDECNRLFRYELCASRQTICEAMAFCFEKSAASSQISDMLKELVMEPLTPSSSTTAHSSTSEIVVDVDTRIARLFLLSDILFNSQQPGVKNAFRYRDAVEKMAPDIMKSFHEMRNSLGRMTCQKLNAAVRSVLAAWTRWGVYNPIFLNELDAIFEGREVQNEDNTEEDGTDKDGAKDDMKESSSDQHIDQEETEEVRPISQGRWSSVTDIEEEEENPDTASDTGPAAEGDTAEKSSRLEQDEDPDGMPIDDPDGVPLDEETCATRPLEGKYANIPASAGPKASRDAEDPDGEPLEPYGELLDEDGAPLDHDGEPFDQDGEPLHQDPLDDKHINGDPEHNGEPIAEVPKHNADLMNNPEDTDGSPVDDADGAPMEDPVGEPIV